MKPWLILFVAGLLEVAWSAGLKASDGFTRPVPSLVTILAMAASVGLLSLAVKALPLGSAYAVWTGIGAVGAVIYGIAAHGEPASLPRLVFVGLILAGIVGLKATSGR